MKKKNWWRTSSFRTEAFGGKSEYVVHVVNSWAMLYIILLLRNKMICFYTVVNKEKYSDNFDIDMVLPFSLQQIICRCGRGCYSDIRSLTLYFAEHKQSMTPPESLRERSDRG